MYARHREGGVGGGGGAHSTYDIKVLLFWIICNNGKYSCIFKCPQKISQAKEMIACHTLWQKSISVSFTNDILSGQ